MRRRHALLFAGIFLLIVIGLALVGRQHQTLTLHDGTVLELLAVTTAGDHSIRTGPNWSALFGWLPSDIREKLPSHTNRYQVSSQSPVGIWISATKTPLPRLLLSGEDGIELPCQAVWNDRGGRDLFFVNCPSIPRNTGKLTLGVVPRTRHATRNRDGEFQFSAPRRDLSSEFSPQPVPQTVKIDDLKVTLESLRSTSLRKSATYEDEPPPPQTIATFKVESPPANRWILRNINVSDRSVGPSVNRAYSILAQHEDLTFKQISVTFDPFPFPNKTWKLNVAFVKDGDFLLQELTIFKDIAIPKTATTIPIGLTKKVNGAQITLVQVSTERPDPSQDRNASITLKIDAGPPETTIALLDSYSSSGTSIPFKKELQSRVADVFTFSLGKIPANVATVSAKVAVHQIRVFEFLAQPEIVDSLKH